MSSEILSRDLAERRRSLLAYSAGLAIYILVVVAVYPAFKNSTSLDQFTAQNAGLAAVLGVTGSITSPAGWLSANIYANFYPLVLLLLTIGYGAFCLAGQEESGHLELVLSLPFSRRSVVGQKMAAMVVQAAILSLVVFASVMCGHFFEMTFSTSAVATTTVGVTLLGIDLGLVAMAIGAATGNRALAVGVTAAVAAASYLVSSLAPVVSAIEPFRYASLFYWSVGDNQMTDGLSLASLAVLVVTGIVAAVAVTCSSPDTTCGRDRLPHRCRRRLPGRPRGGGGRDVGPAPGRIEQPVGGQLHRSLTRNQASA